MGRYAVPAMITALAFALGTFGAHNARALAPVTQAASAAAPRIATVFDLRALRRAPVFRFAPHAVRRPLRRDATEVQLVRAGSGIEWLGDRRVRLAPGTIVVLPPNVPDGRFEGGPFAIARTTAR